MRSLLQDLLRHLVAAVELGVLDPVAAGTQLRHEASAASLDRQDAIPDAVGDEATVFDLCRLEAGGERSDGPEQVSVGDAQRDRVARAVAEARQ